MSSGAANNEPKPQNQQRPTAGNRPRSLQRFGGSSDYHDIDEHERVVRVYRDGSYLVDRRGGRRRYGFMADDPVELQMMAENLMAMACDTTNALSVFDRKTAGDAAAAISLIADRLSPVVGRVTDAGEQDTSPAPENTEQPICETCGQPCVYQGTHP